MIFYEKTLVSQKRDFSSVENVSFKNSEYLQKKILKF